MNMYENIKRDMNLINAMKLVVEFGYGCSREEATLILDKISEYDIRTPADVFALVPEVAHKLEIVIGGEQ